MTGLRTNHDWQSLVTPTGPGLFRVREGGGWPTFVAKAVLGTVPLAEDGSASFLAADRNWTLSELGKRCMTQHEDEDSANGMA